jgi:RNA polymerase sigma factor (sigma-70 family)
MSATDPGSVTILLKGFKGGDAAAFEELWRRYFEKLVALARRQLDRPDYGGEDAAASAFNSFHRRANLGHFPRLGDREDLWMNLVSLARQKVIDQRRKAEARKRSGGHTISTGDLTLASEANGSLEEEVLAGGDPDPAVVAEAAELIRIFMDRLDKLDKKKGELRRIAQLKMEGYTLIQIAVQTGVSVETAQRKAKLIRAILAELLV